MTHDSIETGRWPARRTEVMDWLVNGTRDEQFFDRIFLELCRRLEGAGVSLLRVVVILQIDNPQWSGVRLLWRRGAAGAEARMSGFDARRGAS